MTEKPTTQTTSQPKRQIPIWLFFLGAIVILGGLLALDLRFQGLAWRFFWSQTGEETPIGQLRGMVEVAGNVIRPQPQTAPLVPIQHTDTIPYGINVFLQKEVEEDKMRVMLQMIQDAGFKWLRQEFPWEDIEVDGRGQFTDTRIDYDGDGVPDTIDAWQKYDRMVNLVEEYEMRLLVRLSNPPSWTRADPAKGDIAPPDDVQDFVNFAVAVAERYKGRITHYQIWNEPNLYPEWGNQFVDPAGYVDMLCRTYDALKAVDPDIVVLSAAIGPTISLDGYFGYQDVIYLQRMYDAGAGACFDILSAQGYGLFSGPTDQRRRLTSINSARHVYYRDLMVANGDAHKPIWISEAAWNHVQDAELPPYEIEGYANFGVTTQERAARYMPLYYERAQREWPWIGQISYWFFTRPDPFEAGQSFYYFRMVEPDYPPTFTPLPVYNTMKDYITTQTPMLYQGVHQAEHWAIERSEDAAMLSIDDAPSISGAYFDEAMQTASLRFIAHGTDVQVRVHDGETWRDETLHRSFLPQTVTLTVANEDGTPVMVDAVRVVDNMWRNLLPVMIAGGLILLGGLVLLYRRLKANS